MSDQRERAIRALPADRRAETGLRESGTAEAPPFRTILFPPGREMVRSQRADAPACFIDLNLDQIVAAIVAKRDEDVLRPSLYSPYRDEETVRYQQAVFGDLEQARIFQVFPVFCEAMRSVRANLLYAEKITFKHHRHLVILRAVGLNCDAVASLVRGLRSLTLRSGALINLRSYLAAYTSSAAFTQLATETRDLRDSFLRISYGTLFRGDKVTVRKYASEPDYTVTILERFARFRQADATPSPPARLRDDFSLNHIEQGILDFVGRMFPEQFRQLEDYVARHLDFIDAVIATFDREIGFFIAYLSFIDPLRRAGLPFCHPDVSASDKNTKVSGSFDLALAAKLISEKRSIVCNDFHLSGAERLIVVSGPNQGARPPSPGCSASCTSLRGWD